MRWAIWCKLCCKLEAGKEIHLSMAKEPNLQQPLLQKIPITQQIDHPHRFSAYKICFALVLFILMAIWITWRWIFYNQSKSFFVLDFHAVHGSDVWLAQVAIQASWSNTSPSLSDFQKGIKKSCPENKTGGVKQRMNIIRYIRLAMALLETFQKCNQQILWVSK